MRNKRNSMSKLLGLIFLLFAGQVFAYTGEYRIGLFKDYNVDYNKITHVIVVGSAAKEDSDQFFQAGLSRAIRYKEVFPTHQVVIMSSPEVVDRDDDKVFSDFQINVIKMVENTFYPSLFLNELKAYTKIQSLDYYGHSSPWGLKLGKKDAAFDPSEEKSKLIALKSNFLPNAYITLNSCNSGFNIAPALSQLLELPVAGTLTSGLFERIETDGRWYKEDDKSKINYANQNSFSFVDNIICQFTGACTRMKPSQYNYSSYWGDFGQGLSFSKFFCNFENTNNKCQKGMALSLFTFPSLKPIKTDSDFEDYKTVLFDWLCQTTRNPNAYNNCVNGTLAAISRGDNVFKSHTSSELVCDFKSCHAKVVCKERKIFGSGPKAKSCKLDAETSETPTNIATEFLNFKKGFELLKK